MKTCGALAGKPLVEDLVVTIIHDRPLRQRAPGKHPLANNDMKHRWPHFRVLATPSRVAKHLGAFFAPWMWATMMRKCSTLRKSSIWVVQPPIFTEVGEVPLFRRSLCPELYRVQPL